MKKLIHIIIVMLISSVVAFGQQDPQWTQNMFNRAGINPGADGRKANDICGTLLYRDQNMGFDGNPKTFLFNVNGSFNLFGVQSGGGLTVWSDQAGALKTTVANLSYAYKRYLLGGQLGIGINLGVLNLAIDNAWKATDPAPIDPRIPETGTSNMTFDMGLGVYFERNDMYIGISSQHLVPGVIKAKGNKVANFPGSVDWDQNFDVARHLYLMAGYNYAIPNSSFELRPSLFIKYDEAVPQFDLNCLVVYNKLYWGGLSYRLQDAVAIMGGMDFGAVQPSLKNLKLGLAYDLTTSQLGKYSNGSVEIFLRYCYQIVHPPKIQEVHSVRFL